MPTLQTSSNGHLPKHAIAVDVVLLTIQGGTLKVLLVKREQAPYRGTWALPGGVVGADESVDDAALRELHEETNIGNIYLEQLYTFGDPTRDPRGRVITVAYYALVNWQQFQLKARQRVTEASWFAVKRLPTLAFDHRRIVDYALERLRYKINYTTVGFQLLPREFTLTELQSSYEVILGQRLDKRNFRRKMLQLGILKDTAHVRAIGRQRPARLYTFTEPKVVKLQEKGIIVPF
ncbi:MAG: NUDIX hydrolase [Candidatus Omnitrophica bacterium CG11_big_fil_rev_8_21_14_0_20_63_9]|nr:MAG: NUDIX hydrolase [Candidatus Omnitrophica bacterium CG11_big_fil_rev_8_21_14_0_20_63_9]